MKGKVNLERNKIFHLEDPMIMCMHGVYNAQTVENLGNTLEKMYSKTTWNAKLFAGKLIGWFNWHLSEKGIVHYATNSVLYINILKERYNKMYKKLIHRLEMYVTAVWILSKGYLPISPLPQTKLKNSKWC